MKEMKYIFPLILITFLLSVVVFAQGNDDNCPKISVEGPSHAPRVGDVFKYRATVSGLLSKPIYEWTVSSGTIIKGQGTDEIETIYQNRGWGITATVEIKGLPKNCQSFASDTSPTPDGGDPAMTDQYSVLTWKRETTRLDAVKVDMRKYPNAQVYFLIYEPKKNDPIVKTRIERIKKYFGSDRERLTFTIFESKIRQTKIYLVPPGIDPPRS